jgi:vancomycin resistance protein YoaR
LRKNPAYTQTIMSGSKVSKAKQGKFLSRKISLAVLAILYLAIVVIVGLLYGLQKVYADRVYPGVSLAGIDFSGKTWAKAAEEVSSLARSLEQITISIHVERGETFRPTLAELGVSFDPDQILSNLFSVGRGNNVWQGLTTALGSLVKKRELNLIFDLDQSLTEAYVARTTATLSQKPQNAILKVEGGEIEIIPETPGKEADAQFLRREINWRLRRLQMDSGPTTLPQIYLAIAPVAPTVTKEDLEPIRERAQEMIEKPIVMGFEGKTYTFTPKEIGSWLTFPEDESESSSPYRIEAEETKISASIATKVAKLIDIKMVPKKTLVTTGQVLEEGRDGRLLDRARLLSDIKRQFYDQVRYPIALTVTLVPKTEKHAFPDFTLGLYEGRYIEINLTKQSLYAIEGTTLINEFKISTGKWSTPTPTGTLYIKNKISNAYSRRYRLWMPLWNGLARNQDGSGYDGYGIHELPCWDRNCRYREGIAHLGTPVSHGCIRLGYDGPAQFVYDWAGVGTPVFIHR